MMASRVLAVFPDNATLFGKIFQASRSKLKIEYLKNAYSFRYFHRANTGEFVQEEPRLGNQYTTDRFVQRYLKKTVPVECLDSFEHDLVRFGGLVAGEIQDLSLDCERNPPKLIQQDAWGRRVDNLWTCESWKKMKEISAREGLISIAYERKYGEWSRLYQMVKLYLFAPSSGLFSCPLAMTDGAAKTLESLKKTDERIFSHAYNNLISRDETTFWTSGQWMTEKRGGSDVANGTETLAKRNSDGSYSLYGYKFFSSATDSDMSLTLARIVNENDIITQGTKGLTLFYLETKNQDGDLNNIQIMRLKDKLGTRQLPTAELLLDGTVAHQLSETGRGVSAISTMLSLTRLHNSCASVSAMRRIINLAIDYSRKRVAFNHPIYKYPLHVQTLARMELETIGSSILFLHVSKLLGKIDCGLASEDEKLIFRIITPILKLYSAKQAVAVVSEGLECFGGQGYMEDTGLPSALRDAQVLPIWEGTTNILSLDVLRCISNSKGATIKALVDDILRILENCTNPRLQESRSKVRIALEDISKFLISNTEKTVPAARDLSFSIARTFIGALLIGNAEASPIEEDILYCNRWCGRKSLSTVLRNNQRQEYEQTELDWNLKLFFDE